MNYLRIIHHILAPGGVWINLGMLDSLFNSQTPNATKGPLLWHFENNNTNDPSIELDLSEVKALAHQIGFDLSVRGVNIHEYFTCPAESTLATEGENG